MSLLTNVGFFFDLVILIGAKNPGAWNFAMLSMTGQGGLFFGSVMLNLFQHLPIWILKQVQSLSGAKRGNDGAGDILLFSKAVEEWKVVFSTQILILHLIRN